MAKDQETPLANELEFSKPADTLIEAVVQYLQRTEGQVYSPENVKQLVTKIINRRLTR